MGMLKVTFIISICLLLVMFQINFVNAEKQIKFSELSLEEKIGQLIIVKPTETNSDWVNLNVGGIFVTDRNFTKEDYKNHINYYQNKSNYNLFVTTDMEGYWNPFQFYAGKNFGEINSKEEAYSLGVEQGKIMKELGFNWDFSPIVEVKNKVWPGRSFIGSKKEVEEKIEGYLEGLHSEGIKTTAKHYPGGSMVKNPHLLKYKVEIKQEDLDYFNFAIKKGVGAIMVGHPIVYGAIDSKGKQSTISSEVILPLRENFEGLIITDAVTMLGLSISYFWNFKKAYPDLILAGNDIILDTHKFSNYNQIKRRINYLTKEAEKNPVLMKRINESSAKILKIKGYEVIT